MTRSFQASLSTQARRPASFAARMAAGSHRFGAEQIGSLSREIDGSTRDPIGEAQH
jgi:hypothetical protein